MSRPPFDTLNLGLGTPDDPAAAAENRARLSASLGFSRLVTPYQVHGSAVLRADETTERPRCDALVVDRPGVLVGVLGADCPGVLLVDAAARRLAVAHAGWRGVAAGVVPAAVRALRSPPEQLVAWIGPGIGIERYQVSDDVVDKLAGSLPGVDLFATGIAHEDVPGHARVSLVRAIREQLIQQGLNAARIDAVDACTFDDVDRFYSHRRDGPRAGRHALVAGWTTCDE